LPIIDHEDMGDPIEKRQAKSAGSKKTGKFSIPALSKVEKTSVSIVIIARGLSKDHRKSRTEFLYRSLNSLTVRFLTSFLYLNNLSPNRAEPNPSVSAFYLFAQQALTCDV